MAGRNVNVIIQNWEATGQNVPVPQYGVDVSFEWTGQDNQPHTHSANYKFPNVLQNIPMRRLREYLERIILAEVRIQLAIDEDTEE